LVREHFKTVIVSRHIWKIIHASSREFLLEGDIVCILIVLKNVSQTILGFHSSGVWFQDGDQKVSENCGIYPLKDGRFKGGLLFILDTIGIFRWCLVRRGNNMM
jgi:hypothetical protein